MRNGKKKHKNEKLTIILIPNSGNRAKRLSLTYRQIKGAIMAVAFLSFLLVLAGVNIYQGRQAVSEAKRIKSQHEQQQQQVMELNNKLLEMEKQRERIEERQEQVRKLVGVSSSLTPTATPSRGGVDRNSRTGGTRDLREISAEISNLQYLMDEQEMEILQLLNHAQTNIDQLKAIPNYWPVVGRITSTFGYRQSPFGRSREFHDGLDIAAPYGTEIRAAADGVVIQSNRVPGWGRIVKISHGNGVVTSYAHNSTNLVKKGDRVTKGSVIAKVGSSGRSTGPHVHFTIEKNGKPVDPLLYLP